MSTLPLSVCLVVKNEAERLRKSLAPFIGRVSEIIAYDNGSTDETIAILKDLGVTVVEGPWLGFTRTRKAVWAMAKEEWILWLDADEIFHEDTLAALEKYFCKTQPTPSPSRTIPGGEITGASGPYARINSRETAINGEASNSTPKGVGGGKRLPRTPLSCTSGILVEDPEQGELASPAEGLQENQTTKISSFNNNFPAAFRICRQVIFEGRPIRHGDWFPDWCLRVFRKDNFTMADRIVHESLSVEGKVVDLPGIVEHHSFRSWADLEKRSQWYATLWAQQSFDNKKKPTSPFLHALWKFVRGYFLKSGWLDGSLGFKIALHNAREVYSKYQQLRRLAHDQR